MKIKTVFSIIAVISIALSLSPGIAFAETSGQSSGSPSANQFSLKADDTATLGSAMLVNVSPSYTTIDNTGTLTGESGDNITTNTLWLKLGTPFAIATYSGTIYWQIAQP